MFEQMILPEPRGRKKWTIAVAFLAQVLVLGILVAIPLLYIEPLPLADLTTVLAAPPPPPPPPPPAPPAPVQVAHVVLKHFDAGLIYQPRVVPKTIATIQEQPQQAAAAPVTGGVPGGVTGGQIGGVLGGILGATPTAAPPPAPPPPPVAATPTPAPAKPGTIRIGGAVEAAKIVSAPSPAYPPVAKDARIQGDVLLDAVIGTDGHIENLKVVSGNALLVSAAMNAVKQWTYRPTILNGQPVKVATEIMVHFSLSS